MTSKNTAYFKIPCELYHITSTPHSFRLEILHLLLNTFHFIFTENLKSKSENGVVIIFYATNSEGSCRPPFYGTSEKIRLASI